MPEIIFESPYPLPPLPHTSLFHYLFPTSSPSSPSTYPLQTYDPSLPAYIDALTGRTHTRADVADSALRLTTSLRRLGVRRGDVALLWGMNSLEWGSAFMGCTAGGVVVSPANAG